ncbi:MAG: hypothetical protein KDB80_05620 [Planctomycetes bacterium]|nr:hypothetical protein [Planctomycetota bacterium]
MILRSPKFWLACVSGSVVVWFVSGHFARRAPGPITAVHAQLDAIGGGNSCSACHGGWLSSMTESCLECHPLIATQVETSTGLHGRIGAERASQCSQCHSEHHGASFAIVNRQSFAIAGFAGPDEFDHSVIGFEMDGKHLELACQKCHEHADAEVLAEGERRFLGLDQGCDTCHEDPHEGRMAIACAQCHSQRSWEELGSSGHERFLSLAGGHADIGCRDCHAKDSPRSLEVLGVGSDLPRRECTSCHESPHRPAFVDRVATIVGKSRGLACRACHADQHESFRAESIEVTPELHAASGFGLAMPHDQVACADCHEPHGTFADCYPGRVADDCASCHDDPHRGQFASGPFAEVGCVGCHDRERFEPHGFTLEHHARTSLRLTGRHAEIECSECHAEPVAGEPRRFHGTDDQCVDCHDDAHRGFFDTVAATPAAPGGEVAPHGSCEHCHSTVAFDDETAKSFDHGRWTGFVIDGAHAEARCTDCHPRAEVADPTGRTFGRVAEHFGEMHGCETCHEDPHDGAFDRDGLARRTEFGDGCARCHVPASFRLLPHGFDHLTWTGFALSGAHGTARCSACHEPLEQASSRGRTVARAQGTACADCHADPHAGQFVRGETTDCARCHRVADRFSELRFDHDRHARFRLGDAHRDVSCEACHRVDDIGGVRTTRYRPLPHDCADCHGTARDPLRRRGRR